MSKPATSVAVLICGCDHDMVPSTGDYKDKAGGRHSMPLFSPYGYFGQAVLYTNLMFNVIIL